jgi:hypothetical protein
MRGTTASDLYAKYAGAVAYVAVVRDDGSPSIGSAFHVGEGVFVTARHVVEHSRISEIGTTKKTYVSLEGAEAEGARIFLDDSSGPARPIHLVQPSSLQIEAGPFFHLDPDVDVSVFKVRDLDPRTPSIPLGTHLDDWLGDQFVLEEVVIFGHPPIPMTVEPYLVAAHAEVNATIDLRGGKNVHFVVSAMARGGFSGGPAVTATGIALGVVTRSLLTNGAPAELWFMTVLSVEPIYACLADHLLLPICQTFRQAGSPR